MKIPQKYSLIQVQKKKKLGQIKSKHRQNRVYTDYGKKI